MLTEKHNPWSEALDHMYSLGIWWLDIVDQLQEQRDLALLDIQGKYVVTPKSDLDETLQILHEEVTTKLEVLTRKKQSGLISSRNLTDLRTAVELYVSASILQEGYKLEGFLNYLKSIPDGTGHIHKLDQSGLQLLLKQALEISESLLAPHQFFQIAKNYDQWLAEASEFYGVGNKAFSWETKWLSQVLAPGTWNFLPFTFRQAIWHNLPKSHQDVFPTSRYKGPGLATVCLPYDYSEQFVDALCAVSEFINRGVLVVEASRPINPESAAMKNWQVTDHELVALVRIGNTIKDPKKSREIIGGSENLYGRLLGEGLAASYLAQAALHTRHPGLQLPSYRNQQAEQKSARSTQTTPTADRCAGGAAPFRRTIQRGGRRHASRRPPGGS